VPPKDENKTKSQPTQAHSRKHARVQSLCVESSSDHDVHMTDESESDQSKSERPSKQAKN